MKKEVTLAGCMTLTVSVILFIPLSTLAWGWTVSLLWAWFVLPVFTSAPALSVGHAVGLSFVVSALRPLKSAKSDADSVAGLIGELFGHLVAPFWTLLVAYVCKWAFGI